MICLKKPIMILVIMISASCINKMKERRLLSEVGEYSIRHPQDWNFFDYGFDGDTYYDQHLAPSATLTYGKNLDAKVVIFFLKKPVGEGCDIGNSSPYDYNENKDADLRNERLNLINESILKWKSDHKVLKIKIYFAASDKECVLFELSKGKNDNFDYDNFYRIIKSLN